MPSTNTTDPLDSFKDTSKKDDPMAPLVRGVPNTIQEFHDSIAETLATRPEPKKNAQGIEIPEVWVPELEVTERVFKHFCTDKKSKSLMYHGVRVFIQGTADKILKEEERTTLQADLDDAKRSRRIREETGTLFETEKEALGQVAARKITIEGIDT